MVVGGSQAGHGEEGKEAIVFSFGIEDAQELTPGPGPQPPVHQEEPHACTEQVVLVRKGREQPDRKAAGRVHRERAPRKGHRRPQIHPSGEREPQGCAEAAANEEQ